MSKNLIEGVKSLFDSQSLNLGTVLEFLSLSNLLSGGRDVGAGYDYRFFILKATMPQTKAISRAKGMKAKDAG